MSMIGPAYDSTATDPKKECDGTDFCEAEVHSRTCWSRPTEPVEPKDPGLEGKTLSPEESDRRVAESQRGDLTMVERLGIRKAPGQEGYALADRLENDGIPEHWTFKDKAVADGFDRHVREQLPWYDMVTKGIVQIARHYLGEGGVVYDVGASTGNIARSLDGLLDDRHATMISVEESPEMAERFAGPGSLVVEKVQDLELLDADVIICNLVLMFLRPDEQAATLQKLLRAVKPGGALILVERTLPPSGYLSIVTSRLTLNAKLEAGVSPEEIVTKELSIAGSQRPLDARLVLAMGGTEWFRYGDFVGWVIDKELPRH